jgi:succinoglycan biosynthesis protein ExoM
VGQVVVAICCTTRHRPRMLQALLASWSKLTFPDGIAPVFIVVENDENGASRKLVNDLRKDFADGALVYAVEPEIGIPQARNTAVRIALGQCAKFICFVDDDETVAEDWFVHLYEAHRRSHAQLIGGPVRPLIPATAESAYRRIVQQGIVARYRKIEIRATERLRTGQLGRMAILTNNWFADAEIFTTHGLSFDPELRLSGGSDTQFFRDAVAKGILTDWAPQAVVFETVPPERTSLAYQYRRGREQSKTSIRAKIKESGRLPVLPVLATSVAIRCVGVMGLLLAVPFTGGRSLVAFARSCGWIVGRVAGFLGGRSSLYGEITGG